MDAQQLKSHIMHAALKAQRKYTHGDEEYTIAQVREAVEAAALEARDKLAGQTVDCVLEDELGNEEPFECKAETVDVQVAASKSRKIVAMEVTVQALHPQHGLVPI